LDQPKFRLTAVTPAELALFHEVYSRLLIYNRIWTIPLLSPADTVIGTKVCDGTTEPEVGETMLTTGGVVPGEAVGGVRTSEG
jgi:hypothetical protein